MRTADYWQLLFSDRFTGARNPARLPTTDAIPSNPLRPLSNSFYHLRVASPHDYSGNRNIRNRTPRAALPRRPARRRPAHLRLRGGDAGCAVLPAARRRLSARGGGGYYGAHGRHHVRTSASRIRARSDPWLWRGSAYAQIERVHESGDTTGFRRSKLASGWSGFKRGVS